MDCLVGEIEQVGAFGVSGRIVVGGLVEVTAVGVDLLLGFEGVEGVSVWSESDDRS